MIWFLVPFAMIGAGVVTLIIIVVSAELIRAARQSKRVAAVAVRYNCQGRRRITAKEWCFAFRRELTSGYSSLRIGYVDIPRNPDQPMRARLPH
ncbi:hypothetical protein DEM27_05765 [Metarhizobium album]|uniref:Uncharacterized protein n=1 Tax=Metarhizobium album TaxID=2182425 RepID=A0A2U2DV20_9HYPH|nr:hypothetical protein [Rhizobium album]PWE57147.1 hypothetical protein DEM27_05765 [Rhizobium album]